MPLTKIILAGKRSKAEELYEFLHNAILDGIFEPNERVIEENIAAMASVSRTPVREAIRRLEADNLVQDTGQGLVIGSVSPDELAELCTVREVLEGLASRLAATARSEIDVLNLQNILHDYQQATEKQDIQRLVTLNHAFHETIWQAARNRYLFRELITLRRNIERLQKTTLSEPRRQREALAQHKAVLEAIINRDGDTAERLAHQHFREAMALRLKMERLTEAVNDPSKL
ncbi:MAG: GntR family transcriptional regulator [Chloroflexi bacterium]|nr:GntR family transcriptional regulator [Chloroflexota bacterium]